jgi:hypothetical protein
MGDEGCGRPPQIGVGVEAVEVEVLKVAACPGDSEWSELSQLLTVHEPWKISATAAMNSDGWRESQGGDGKGRLLHVESSGVQAMGDGCWVLAAAGISLEMQMRGAVGRGWC